MKLALPQSEVYPFNIKVTYARLCLVIASSLRGVVRSAWSRSLFSVTVTLMTLFAPIVSIAFSSPPPRTKQQPSDTPKTVEQLLSRFRAMPGLEARFEETKKLKLLAAPLSSRGRLYYLPPSTLLRQVSAPQKEDVLVSRDVIRRRHDGREETFDLSAHAQIRPLVESILWIFAGDTRSLNEAYRIDFSLKLKSNGWRLTLVPKSAPLNHMVRELVMEGQGFSVKEVSVLETTGDITRTRIFDANPERLFTESERAALFRENSR